jgi:hypothetical protein
MERTLQVINGLKADGVIENYAIGGAIAAMFYIAPFATEDLDVFFVIKETAAGALDFLAPIYEYLTRRGYQAEGVMINIEGWPVQFLPLYSALVEEAVAQANETEYHRTPVRVIRAEHLVAIMLDTGRPKDYARITYFLEAGLVDMESLMDILARHQLETKWRDNRGRFMP